MPDPMTPLPFWARPRGFAALLVVCSLPRLVIALRLGLLSDEAYYALWSLYPTYGYFDHSPGIAWVVAAGRWLFGEGIVPVRSLTVLAGFVTCGLLYRLGTVLFGDARVGALAGYFYIVSIGALLSFNIATPDGISTLFWVAAVWAAAEGGASRNADWWLAVGLFAGLGLLSKYTNVFLAPGLAAYVLVARREALGRWQLWAGAALAVLLFLPVVLWNAEHDWISFRFQLERSSLSGTHGGIRLEAFILYWVAISGLLLPPAMLLVLATLPGWLRWRDRARGLDLPWLSSLPMLGFFAFHSLVNTANPNWLAPVFPSLMLLAGQAAVTLRPRRWWLGWPLAALRWLQVPLGLALLVGLGTGVVLGELPGIGLRNVLSYGRGWSGVATQLSHLAAANRAQWADTETYLIGSLVAYGAIGNRDSLPVLQSNEAFRYGFRPQPSAAMLAAPHLLLRETSADTPPPQPGMRAVGLIRRVDGGNVLGRYAVYLVGAP